MKENYTKKISAAIGIPEEFLSSPEYPISKIVETESKSGLMPYYYQPHSDGSYTIGRYSKQEYADLQKMYDDHEASAKFHEAKNPPNLYDVITVMPDGNTVVSERLISNNVDEAWEEAKSKYGVLAVVRLVERAVEPAGNTILTVDDTLVEVNK